MVVAEDLAQELQKISKIGNEQDFEVIVGEQAFRNYELQRSSQLPQGSSQYIIGVSADRYMYVAIIGFAWLIAFLLQKIPLQKMILPIILVVALGSLSFIRNTKWKNSITLYEDILKKYPNNFLALNSLGVENMQRNNDDRALMYFNKATNVAPYNYKGFYNKGLWYLKNNNPKKAIEEFNTVIVMYNYPKAYVARASAYYALMDYAKARKSPEVLKIRNKIPVNVWERFIENHTLVGPILLAVSLVAW